MKTRVDHVKNKDKYSPDETVFIGRPSKWGNPFVIGRHGTREECIEQFSTFFLTRIEEDLEYRASTLALKGKVLLCFCRPDNECHGDIIAEWCDSSISEEGPVSPIPEVLDGPMFADLIQIRYHGFKEEEAKEEAPEESEDEGEDS